MADQEQVDLLRLGSEKWNHWRRENNTASIDLSKSDLSEANLSSANLLSADLSLANLSGAKLRYTNLSGANLSEANLRSADLYCANLRSADLSKVNLSVANLGRADLSEANLIGADFSNADLSNVNLSVANLERANLYRANLISANLSEINLYSADLNLANLIGANLRSANLSVANLYRADLVGADLSLANFSGAKLSYTNLSGANLTCANIEYAALNYAVLDGETLIVHCRINDSTYAYGVGLDSARIEESLKTKLKKNIRKKYWVDQYQYYLDLKTVRKILALVFSRRLLIAIHQWIYKNITRKSAKRFLRDLFTLALLKSCLVRAFWWTSDYGSSTTRLLQSFLITSVIYTFIYFLPVFIGSDHSFIQGIQFYKVIDSSGRSVLYPFNLWGILLRAFYFSVVTMTTLGFGDISANPASTCGHFLVISQVLIGYVLLGALITRLSILFQDVR